MSQNHEFPNLPGDDERSLFDSLESLSKPNPIANFNKKAQDFEDGTNLSGLPYDAKLALAKQCLNELNAEYKYQGERITITGKALERYMRPCEDKGQPAYKVIQELKMLEDVSATSEGYMVYIDNYNTAEDPIRFMHTALADKESVISLPNAGRVYSQSSYLLPVDGTVEIAREEVEDDAHTPLLEYFAPHLLTTIDNIIEVSQTDDEYLHELSELNFAEYERFFDDPGLAEELVKYLNIMRSVKKKVDVTLYGANEIIVPNDYDQACLSRAVSGSPLTIQIEKVEFSPPVHDQTQPKTAANSRLALGGYVLVHDEKGEADITYAYVPLTQRLRQQQRLSFGLYD